MRQSFSVALAVLALPVVLSGCSSMYNKSFQKIMIYTPGVENVDCGLETEANKYRVIAPGEVMVERTLDTMTVTCEKAGYVPNVTELEGKIRAASTQLNFFNGFLGVPYDIANNAVYAYPDTISVKMVEDPSTVVPLQPIEVNVLQKKKEHVTPKDVEAAKGDAPKDPKAADKAVNQSSRK